MAWLRYVFLTVAVFGLSHGVYAITCGPVTVNVPSASALGIQSTVESEVCSQIDSKFKTSSITPVLSYMAKAYASSNKGLTADYFSNMQVFTLGGALSVAVSNISPLPTSSADLETLKKKYTGGGIPDAGMGLTANASLGISFRHLPFRKRGFFDPKNINIYGSVLVTPAISYDIYSVKLTSFAGYIQYKILPLRKIPFGLLTWGGLDAGVGYSYSSTVIGISNGNNLTTITFPSNGQDVKYVPAGSLTFGYTSHVIPVELSTNVSILYFLSLAVGGAVDFHVMNSSTIAATVTGPVTVTNPATGTTVGGSDDYARFSFSETGTANGVSYRLFFGPQLNIWKIRIFALMHMAKDASYAATFGTRFAW